MDKDGGATSDVVVTGPLNTITNTLLNKLIPQLYQYLIKGGDKDDDYDAKTGKSVRNAGAELRVPIALAIVKILKKLPGSLIIGELERLLSRICGLLANRDQRVRDTTRKTLVRITKDLGAEYVKVVLRQLKLTLHSGFMVHVLSFSLHAILSGVYANPQNRLEDTPSSSDTIMGDASKAEEASVPKSVDFLLKDLIEILDDDIFGRVAQQRNSENYRPRSQLSEAKTCKSYDTFELLARNLTFLPCLSVHVLVSPLVSKLDGGMHYEDAGSIDGIMRAPTVTIPAKIEKACRDVLVRIGTGLARNPTVEAKPMMIYIHSLLSKYLPASVHGSSRQQGGEFSDGSGSNAPSSSSSSSSSPSSSFPGAQKKKRKRPTSRPSDTHLIPAAPRLTGYDQHITHMTRGGVFHHVWVEYALGLLHNTFRLKVLNRTDMSHCQLLDPFCPILARCLRLSKENRVTVLALRCLCAILSWEELPSLPASIPTIIDQTFRLLRIASNGSKGKEVQHVGFQVVTHIMHTQKGYKFNDTRFRALIGLVRANMEDMHSQSSSFALIKALLSRRVLVPELYDLMQHCSSLLVTSHRAGIQKLCGQVFLKFILEYPLSKKRRQQHLDDLVANLKFEYEAGRLAVMSVFRNIMSSWPVEALNEQAKNFFLHLPLRIANESSVECRGVLFQILETLLTRIQSTEFESLMGFLLQWMQPRDDLSEQTNRMACASLQVAVIALQARAALLKGPLAQSLLKHCLTHISREAKCIEDGDAPNIVENDSSIMAGSAGLTTWCPTGRSWEPSFFSLAMVEVCLKYIYIPTNVTVLLRTLPGMMLHRHHFVRLASSRLLGQYFALQTEHRVSIDNDTTSMYLRKMCRLLEGTYLDAMLVDSVVRNLCFLSRLMCNPAQRKSVAAAAALSAHPALKAVGPQSEDELKPLNWLFHRMSFLARKKRLDHDQPRFELRATAVLQWMASMLQLDGVGATYAGVIMAPVFRLVNSDKYTCSNDTRALAQELMEMLQGKISKELFLNVHEAVRNKVTEDRAERNRMRAQERITDPESAALYKMKRNEAKKRSRDKKKFEGQGRYKRVKRRTKNNDDILG